MAQPHQPGAAEDAGDGGRDQAGGPRQFGADEGGQGRRRRRQQGGPDEQQGGLGRGALNHAADQEDEGDQAQPVAPGRGRRLDRPQRQGGGDQARAEHDRAEAADQQYEDGQDGDDPGYRTRTLAARAGQQEQRQGQDGQDGARLHPRQATQQDVVGL
ncbi:hypothetical protein D3C85_1311050 [compost metagenome]